DEPTRGVDVGAKAEIHSLVRRLAGEGRAVVLISSDLPEGLAESDRGGVFRGGRLVTVLDRGGGTAEDVAAAAVPTPGGKTEKGRKRVRESKLGAFSALSPALREGGLLVVLLLLFSFLQVKTGDFLSADGLRDLATNAALLGFCAAGATLVILAGGLDISLGALMALSAGIAGQVWEQGWPWPVVAALALGIGALGGLLNSTLSLIGRVHPVVVRSGRMSVSRGRTLWWLTQDVQIAGEARNWIFAEAAGVPLIAWLGLALLVLTWLLLHGTTAGRQLYALGSN